MRINIYNEWFDDKIIQDKNKNNLMFYLNLSGIFICLKQNISFNKGMPDPQMDDSQVKSLPE